MEKGVYNAAVNGDLTIFSNKNKEQLLKKTYQNNNIVHIAAQHKQLDFIKAALNSFPSTPTSESLICDPNCHGNTPLHIASEVGDEAIINHLYKFFSTQCGISDRVVLPWRMVNEDGNTPAHVALLSGNFLAAIYLVDKDGDYVARVLNHSKETLLHLAIQYHVVENCESQTPESQAPSYSRRMYQPTEDLWPIVEMLLKIDSSVTCWADADGSTPLHRAASLEPAYCLRVIKAMLASCPEAAEVNDGSGHTILHLLMNHQVSIYEEGKKLLSIPHVSALINSKNHQRDTPLHLAARNRDITMVHVLLESSPKLGLKNKNGVSAGSLVRQLEEMRITQKLIEHQRTFTEDECEAVEKGYGEFLTERLVSLGMNFLVSQTPRRSNILHLLVQSDYMRDHIHGIDEIDEKVEEFIGQAIQRRPSLISEQDCNGDTPIHIIVDKYKSSLQLLELVCKYFKKAQEEVEGDYIGGLHSLPWRLKNVKGDTPLHVAIRTENYKCAITLLEFDEVVAGYVNNRKETPLHLLSSRNDQFKTNDIHELISKVIIGNADIPFMQDEDGFTPLLTAVRERDVPIIQKLYQQSPNSSKIADLKGRTLWHMFVYRLPNFSLDDFNSMSQTCKFLIHQNSDSFMKELMVSKDNNGDTPVHLAIKNHKFGYAQFFLANGSVAQRPRGLTLQEENNEGVSCYDLIGSTPHLPVKFEKFLFDENIDLYGFRSSYGVPTSKIEEYANIIGVVAALLATITFTAAFTVPGGLNSNNGTPLLLREAAFQVFMVADVVGMCTSMMVLFCHLWIMTASYKEVSIILLDASISLLQISFHATLITFMMGLYVTVIPIVPAIAIFTCVICTFLVVLMMHQRLFMLTFVRFFVILFFSGWLVRHILSKLSSALSKQKTQVETTSSEEE